MSRDSQRFGFILICFLHDDALGATAGTLAGLAHIHLAFRCAGAERAGARV